MSIKLQDFADIVDAVMEELKYQSTDTTSEARIKRDINMIYLNEVVPFKRWFWLRGNTTVKQPAYYNAGTVAVTPDSTTITFSTAPAASQAGKFFATDNFSEIYKIASHTAGATTATLDIAYNGTLATEATFKIWSDTLVLPTDLKEVLEAWHDYSQETMKPRGLQEFRRDVAISPRFQDRPYQYTITDFVDPSTADDESESDRYRAMKLYPAVLEYATPIHIDYIKEASDLELDGDEPLMPIGDRMVLVYGALSRAWLRERNPEAAVHNRALFEQKLARMAGDFDEGDDTPQLQVDASYFRGKRGPRVSKFRGSPGTGGGSYSAPTYLKDVKIDGARISADLTVDAGVLIDGRDISADGATLDTLTSITGAIDTPDRVIITDGSAILDESTVTSTELTYLEDVSELTTVTLTDASSAVVASWSAATFDTLYIDYSITRGAGNIESGIITLVSDGTSASMSQGAIADLGTLGVTLSADVNGGNVRLLYTTTATGTNATFKYKAHKWDA